MSHKKIIDTCQLGDELRLSGASSTQRVENRETSNVMDMYMQELKSFPVPTHETQTCLAKNIQKWKRRRDVLLFTNPMCVNWLFQWFVLVENGNLVLNDIIDYRRENVTRQNMKPKVDETNKYVQRNKLIGKLSVALKTFLVLDEKRRRGWCVPKRQKQVMRDFKKSRQEMLSLIRLVALKSQAVTRLSEELNAIYRELSVIHETALSLFQKLNRPVSSELTFEAMQAMLNAALKSQEITSSSRVLIGEVEIFLNRLRYLTEHVTYMPLDEFSKVITQVNYADRQMNCTKCDLVQSNQRLVLTLARKYSGKHLDLMDFIQEGNIGLIKAAERFDYRHGSKFSTYAVWWIRQAMTRALEDQDSGVRIPVHMIHAKRFIQRAKRNLTQQLGRHPSTVELSNFSGTSLTHVQQIGGLIQEPASFDALPSTSASSQPPYRWLQSNDSSPLDNVVYRQMHERIFPIFGILNPKEQDIVRRHYGLGAEMEESDRTKIGKTYGVTRERIRQIENKAFEKLRRSRYVRGLRSYVQSD